MSEGIDTTLRRCIHHVSVHVPMIIQRIKIFEYVLSVICDNPLSYCGSRADGIHGRGSDTDFMYEAQDVTVVAATDSLHVKRTHLVYETDNTHPGYCTINVAGNSKEDTTEFGKFGPGLWNLCFEGTNILSPDRVKKYWLTKHDQVFPNNGLHQNFQEHGPALIRQFSCERQSVEIDALLCLPTLWPNNTREFSDTSQSNGWPPSEVIQKVKICDCHLVPTGHKFSKDQDREWRFSFAKAERELIWSFNPTQYACINLLKLLFQTRINSIYPDVFPSYYLKTTMFWLLEETKVAFWVPANIIQCLKVSFDRVLKHITTKNLPHYFIPSNNLLDAKPDCELENSAKILFNCSRDIKLIWIELGHLLLAGKQENPIYRHHIFMNCLSLSRHMIFALKLNIPLKRLQADQLKKVSSLCEKAKERGFQESIFDHFIAEMESYAVLVRHMEAESQERKICEEQTICVLEKMKQLDFCSGRLNLASFMYAIGCIDEALKTAKDVYEQYDDRKIHYSFWTRNKTTNESDYTAEERHLTFNETKAQFIALDFLLLPEQTLIPVPETLSSKVLFLQPIFYSLYLQYLCLLSCGRTNDLSLTLAKLTDFREKYEKSCDLPSTYMADFIDLCRAMTVDQKSETETS